MPIRLSRTRSPAAWWNAPVRWRCANTWWWSMT